MDSIDPSQIVSGFYDVAVVLIPALLGWLVRLASKTEHAIKSLQTDVALLRERLVGIQARPSLSGAEVEVVVRRLLDEVYAPRQPIVRTGQGVPLGVGAEVPTSG